MKTGLPAATKAQKETFAELVDQIGCACCLFVHKIEGSEGGIHHITQNGRRISHDHVIPLCSRHHQYGTSNHPSIHANGSAGGKAQFKEVHGVDEFELLEKSESWIDRAYSSESK